jgi:hypothetical protein
VERRVQDNEGKGGEDSRTDETRKLNEDPSHSGEVDWVTFFPEKNEGQGQFQGFFQLKMVKETCHTFRDFSHAQF